MNNRSGLGFSSVQALSSSDQGWKERLGKIAIFLCLLILIGLFFSYISGATHKIGSQTTPSDPPEVGWDLATQ